LHERFCTTCCRSSLPGCASQLPILVCRRLLYQLSRGTRAPPQVLLVHSFPWLPLCAGLTVAPHSPSSPLVISTHTDSCKAETAHKLLSPEVHPTHFIQAGGSTSSTLFSGCPCPLDCRLTSPAISSRARTEACASRGWSSDSPKMEGKNSGRILPSARLASVTAACPPFLQEQEEKGLFWRKEGGGGVVNGFASKWEQAQQVAAHHGRVGALALFSAYNCRPSASPGPAVYTQLWCIGMKGKVAAC